MSKRHGRLRGGALLWLSLAGLIWWHFPEPGAGSSRPWPAAFGAQIAVEVTMTENRFVPGTIRVAAGATVTWRNTSNIEHTVTGSGFDSGPIAPGESDSLTLARPGSYSYWRIPHRQAGMVGTVLVQG